MDLKKLDQELKKLAQPKKAEASQRFFKTSKGEYGEGDLFLGVTVPELRKLAKKAKDTFSFNDLQTLLESKFHEKRLLGLITLVLQYEKAERKEQKRFYDFYLRNFKYINNWDLVDTSAPKILGPYLFEKDKKILHQWAKSKNLWKRRIAILTTFYFIRQDHFKETLEISKILLQDPEDLMHKAVGWMLREVGNRDLQEEEKFLKKHYKKMPRTMLRYAIEKFPEKRRKAYLEGKI